MAKPSTPSSTHKKPKVRRRGIHSKKKASTSKNAKHYKKSYKGQGK